MELSFVASAAFSRLASTALTPLKERFLTRIVPSSLHPRARQAVRMSARRPETGEIRRIRRMSKHNACQWCVLKGGKVPYALLVRDSWLRRRDGEDDPETDDDDGRDGDPDGGNPRKDAGLPQGERGADHEDEVTDQIEVNEAHLSGQVGRVSLVGLVESCPTRP